MRILISNDDGINAVGINKLADLLSQEHEVIVVAPDKERSSCGHGITLSSPLRVHEVSPNRYSCSGFPADCILIGLGHILKDKKPDLVVSGINHGANLGQDRYYSGTIAAAREAVFRGIPSVAVSLACPKQKKLEHFDTAAKVVSNLIRSGIVESLPLKSLINVNVPNVDFEQIQSFEYTHCGTQRYTEEVLERFDGRGNSYYWVGGQYDGHEDIAGSDCNAVADQKVSVNVQCLGGKEITDTDKLARIKGIIDSL